MSVVTTLFYPIMVPRGNSFPSRYDVRSACGTCQRASDVDRGVRS